MNIKVSLDFSYWIIGLFWREKTTIWKPGRWPLWKKELHLSISLFPCVPIHIWWTTDSYEESGDKHERK